MTLRLATKAWKRVVDALIAQGVKSGKFLVHDGNDISTMDAMTRMRRSELVMRVIFLLNITKIGVHAFINAINLVVDIPEGVKRIGDAAFNHCSSLTTVSFPTTPTLIG